MLSSLVHRALRWVGRNELGSLLSLLALALGILVFAEAADEVGDGDAESIDRVLLLTLRNPADLADPIGPEWLEEMGRDITALSPRERALAGLGYVPQTRDVFSSLSVEENLVAGLKGRPRRCVDEAYALFPRLAERRGHGGAQLSGGEQQMLTVARTLLGQPRLLLLDEPLEGLAPIIVEELLRSIARVVRDEGLSAIIVEQNPRLILGMTEHAVVLDRGRVAHAARSEALARDTGTLERLLSVAQGH